MFNIVQIISATELVRNFRDISRYLYDFPQPLLVTQKGKEHLVLVNADIFQDLVHFKLEAQGTMPKLSGIRDYIQFEKVI